MQHVNAKIFVEGELTIDWERLIEVFHCWVAQQSMEELLVDIADYRHVPHGPGVVLVGHEADYALDNRGGRLGLRYNCKIAREGSNEDRVRQALAAAAGACSRLEAEFEGLTFNRHQIELTINDRALAPNNQETFEACSSELPRLLESIFGTSNIQFEYDRDPRHLFGATVTLARPFDLASLTVARTPHG